MTGADWYLAEPAASMDDLESCFRLEVSGINRGTSADLRRRLREKLAQAAKGASNLPAIASVVGFNAREVMISATGE